MCWARFNLSPARNDRVQINNPRETTRISPRFVRVSVELRKRQFPGRKPTGSVSRFKKEVCATDRRHNRKNCQLEKRGQTKYRPQGNSKASERIYGKFSRVYLKIPFEINFSFYLHLSEFVGL